MTSRNLESFVAEMCFKWLLGTIIWAAGKLWPSYPSPDKGLDIRRLSFHTLASVRLTWHVTLFELVVSCHWQLFICSARSIACYWRNAPNIWKKHDTLWTFHKNPSAIKTDAMQLSYFFQSWNGRNHSTWFRIFCEPCNHGCQVLFTTWSYACTLTLFNHSSYLLLFFSIFSLDSKGNYCQWPVRQWHLPTSRVSWPCKVDAACICAHDKPLATKPESAFTNFCNRNILSLHWPETPRLLSSIELICVSILPITTVSHYNS